MLDRLDLPFRLADRIRDRLAPRPQHGAEHVGFRAAAEAVDVLAHAVAVALQFEDVEAVLDDVVGEFAAHGGDRIEAAGLALVEDDVVDEPFQHQHAFEVLRVGELGVVAGIVVDAAAHRVLQEFVGGLQLAEMLHVAAGIRMRPLGGLAIGALDRLLACVAVNSEHHIGIDQPAHLSFCLHPSPALA